MSELAEEADLREVIQPSADLAQHVREVCEEGQLRDAEEDVQYDHDFTPSVVWFDTPLAGTVCDRR